MLSKGEVKEYDALYLHDPLQVGGVTLPPGYYTKDSTMHQVEFFRPGDQVLQQFAASNVQIKQMLTLPSGELCIESVHGGISCAKGAKVERRTWSVAHDKAGGFQQTLIYSGRIGNKINAVYREASDGYARPAFDNRIEYDLGESNVIGYKGARLEVLEATNQHIKYRVLKHFAE